MRPFGSRRLMLSRVALKGKNLAIDAYLANTPGDELSIEPEIEYNRVK
jgi:hypothetical protein